ncbi:MAG TPA: pirin family protein [Polyangiaceae bacterium]|nr:pirin family protein [Polyangiaceae bacterium]
MNTGPSIELVIEPRGKDLGGFSVQRVLPQARRRHLGPFVFLDHMGPATLGPTNAMDVRPHPHIALATVTYLYEGEILHRDSLGSECSILPGAVNWMTAGRGIVHSERERPEVRRTTRRIHGLQLWVALPQDQEECEPAFTHYPADSLPEQRGEGIVLRVLAGSAFGLTSPVATLSRLFYVDAGLTAGARLSVEAEHEERGAYLSWGSVRLDGREYTAPLLLIFTPGVTVELEAIEDTRLALLGGDSLGDRHMYWNFVSSSADRIEQAKADWRAGKFPRVPGDEVEFIPLPED